MTSRPDRRPARRRATPSRAAARDGALRRAAAGKYLLRLYVTGSTPRSARAIENIKDICEEHLKGRYDLEVIDVYQRPRLAADEQIVATPTLIKVLPTPLRRLIGDLSDSERVLVGLDLKAKAR
jgi:circadian clock protein KaiB